MAGSVAQKEKEVVLITGCSDGGIGAALAVEFVKAGYKVVATSLNTNFMKELCLNEDIHPWAIDVTDYQGAKAAVEGIIAEHGHIDILVNNAGIPCVAPIAEMPIALLEKTFRTNVFGPVVLINAVVPHMVARGKGRIVNIGSVISRCYGPWTGGYSSSKAALEALTDALRLELRPFGINVVLILGGAITSNIGNVALSTLQSDVLQNLKVYKPFEDFLLNLVLSTPTIKRTPTAEFAKKAVVQMTAKSPPAHYVYGHFAIPMSVLFYAPFWLRDFIWTKSLGIDKVKVQAFSEKKTD